MVENNVYILFSDTLNQFYIGETVDFEASKANDWELFLKIVCKDRVQARKIETHIKSMKSKKYINDLKDYPEIINRLIQRY